MIDPKSHLGRLCGAVAAAEPLADPHYGWESGREAALKLAVTETARRPHLREDAEQTALLALWEATEKGTRELPFIEIKRAIQRALRDLISDCTEKRRKDAEPPPYTIDFPALLDPESYADTKTKSTLQKLIRITERYGVEAVVTFTRFRYLAKQRRFSAAGAGRRVGMQRSDAVALDKALRRINPAYQQVIEKRRSEVK